MTTMNKVREVGDDIVATLVKLCHESNRVYCQSIDDYSQASWDDAPDWQKDSATDGVRNLIKNPTFTAQQSHENWIRHKTSDGWIYGDKKSEEYKTHPCLVRYELLSESQKVKDHIFRSVVLGFLETFLTGDEVESLTEEIRMR